MLQSFVPELQILRNKHITAADGVAVAAGLQAEIVATFGAGCAGSDHPCSLSLLGDGKSATVITLDIRAGLVTVDATGQGNSAVRGGPLPLPNARGGWTVHAIADHAIVEVIVNNATAFVVYAAPTAASGDIVVHGGRADVWTLDDANNI